MKQYFFQGLQSQRKEVMTVLIQLQEGNNFRENTEDKAVINGELANLFTFQNMTYGNTNISIFILWTETRVFSALAS